MTDDRHYVPGDYYQICDRTGFKVRAKHMRREWTNAQVRDQSFERRHPQDFVKGVPDDQRVPIARPRSVNVFVGPLTTTLAASVPAGTQILPLASSTRMVIGDRLNIMMNNGTNQVTFITDIPSSSSVQISPVMSWAARSGNLVVDVSAESTVTLP